MRERANNVPLYTIYARPRESFMDRLTKRSGAILHVVVPAVLLVGMLFLAMTPLMAWANTLIG